MHRPLLSYLQEIGATRAIGANTPETSFYPALKSLLDSIGLDLDPKVRCVMNLRNQGAGLPDGGLFSADQLVRSSSAQGIEAAFPSLKPNRGAIEVKPPSEDLDGLIRSKQAARYGEAYRHLVLTNLREFALVEYSEAGAAVVERFQLASSESAFWRLCAAPTITADLERRFTEFLHRILRTPAPLSEPEDLAWFLASYAREALVEIEHAPIPGLSDIAAHLEASLGISFGFGGEEDASLSSGAKRQKAQHFFRSILVQTLFYGVFSAWVLWHQEGSRGARFSWREATGRLHLTVLNVLFHEMTRPTALFSTVLRKRIELAEATLNRVDAQAFFRRFQQHEAVQYFYEPFLAEFDPQLRKELGVWYTPHEIVQYMVERVDRTLREEFGIADGLASPEVLVLDPCCGTGAFLIAVLERIHRSLREQGADGLAAAAVQDAATRRVFGFEILPAPFVISHLQVNLFLESIGVGLPKEGRAAVYLTNALTGWEPPVGRQIRLWEGLKEERDLADQVKRKAKVLVVIGNPPYNAFAGVQPADEGSSVNVYKEGLVAKWKIRKFNLDELYVRFLRLAERKIVEQARRGIVCYVSNASYASDKSFVVLREKFLQGFDSITIDNCNGDSRETGKLTPEGRPDPSIFSTPRNREGIRVGTVIGQFVLSGKRRRPGQRTRVRWRDFWGETKRQDLLHGLDGGPEYIQVEPTPATFWSFKPQRSSANYSGWPRIVELCGHAPISGLAEKRKGGLLCTSEETLRERMKAYLDRDRDWQDVAGHIGGLGHDAADYPARATRAKLLKAGLTYTDAAIRRYALLPLDTRWCYWADAPPLWNRARSDLTAQFWEGNRALISRTAGRRPGEGWPALPVSELPDHHLLDPNVIAIPFLWRSEVMGQTKTDANVSEAATSYLRTLGIQDSTPAEDRAALLWYHVVCMCYSTEWSRENSESIRADFPRVPMPAERAVLERSAALGRQVADLLAPEIAVDGVTSGRLRPELRPLGVIARQDAKPIQPARGDLDVSARWGGLQRGAIVMPGPGRLTTSKSLDLQGSALGPQAFDVWLNNEVRIEGVPEAVWKFTIGGYQVIKKWLSYRERAIHGRALSLDEARHLTSMVRRIAALLLLMPQLDEVYRDSRDRHAWCNQ